MSALAAAPAGHAVAQGESMQVVHRCACPGDPSGPTCERLPSSAGARQPTVRQAAPAARRVGQQQRRRLQRSARPAARAAAAAAAAATQLAAEDKWIERTLQAVVPDSAGLPQP